MDTGVTIWRAMYGNGQKTGIRPTLEMITGIHILEKNSRLSGEVPGIFPASSRDVQTDFTASQITGQQILDSGVQGRLEELTVSMRIHSTRGFRMETKEDKFFSLKAKDLMSLNPKTIQSNEKLINASEIMSQRKINSLAVVNDNNNLVGIVQMYDLGI